MPVSSERDDGILTVKPEGRINSADAAIFRHELVSATEPGDRAVIMDMESLDYISSGGLRVMLEFAQTLSEQDAKFALCSLKSSVNDVFRISGFDRVVTICTTRDEAVAAVSR